MGGLGFKGFPPDEAGALTRFSRVAAALPVGKVLEPFLILNLDLLR